jgi:phage protein D
LPHTYSTESNARRAARSKLDDFSRSSGGQIQLSMPARLDIIAETPVVVMGVRQGIDGQYVVRRVSHTLTGTSGLLTSLDCEKSERNTP